MMFNTGATDDDGAVWLLDLLPFCTQVTKMHSRRVCVCDKETTMMMMICDDDECESGDQQELKVENICCRQMQTLSFFPCHSALKH